MWEQKPSILIVEDVGSQAAIYQGYLKDVEAEITLAATGKKAEDFLYASTPPDLVLLDLTLPDKNGMDILKEMQNRQLPTVSVVITANGSMKAAVEAMQYGAYDFLVKPFEKEKLLVTVKNALEKRELKQAIESLKEFERTSFHGFIGSSLPMQAIYRQIESVASSQATVFIKGESGTGKEVAARAIHEASPRGNKPFIALNCGAIPKDLIESEVFGHVKGAFTGASSDREGAAKRADGGTLFLDEIGEMDLNLQVKLLRFLQTGTYTKVGGEREEKVDIRIICATNRDPWAEVQAGRFREDLYYRLHVIPITMPPLRTRGQDVLELAHHFLETISAKEKKTFKSFAPEVQVVMQNYKWPGNVRELLNVVQNIVVMNQGEEVALEMLPPPLDKVSVEQSVHPMRRATDFTADHARTGVLSIPLRPDQIRPLAELERQIIEQAIRACGGNIPKAASHLGINPSTIYRKKTAWEAEEQDQAS